MSRNFHITRKSSRVADESCVPAADDGIPSRARWNGGFLMGIICGIVRASFTLMSCASRHPRMGGTDGVWVSAEMRQTSELNDLMVRDCMRYAIMM